jgi:hypothetical protein
MSRPFAPDTTVRYLESYIKLSLIDKKIRKKEFKYIGSLLHSC